MKHSELFRFTCQCLSLNTHPESVAEVRDAFASGRVEVDRFIQFASNNFVLPAIYLQFKKADLLSFFPKAYINHLEEVLQLNIQRNTEILSQIKEISDALAESNIEPVFMKGTGNLLAGLYSSPGERMIGDIDILIRESDLIPAQNLIKKLGYTSEDLKFETTNTIKHLPRLFRKDVPADIEIHRITVNEEYAGAFNTEENFNTKQLVKTYPNCFVQSLEHRLIQNFIHSQFSNDEFSQRRISLRDWFDYYLLSQKIDIEKVSNKFPYKNKLIKYHNLVHFLACNEFLNSKQKAHYYTRQVMWFADHPSMHRVYITGIKFIKLFIVRQLFKVKLAIKSTAYRKNLSRKLFNPRWYKIVFSGLWSYFKS